MNTWAWCKIWNITCVPTSLLPGSGSKWLLDSPYLVPVIWEPQQLCFSSFWIAFSLSVYCFHLHNPFSDTLALWHIADLVLRHEAQWSSISMKSLIAFLWTNWTSLYCIFFEDLKVKVLEPFARIKCSAFVNRCGVSTLLFLILISFQVQCHDKITNRISLAYRIYRERIKN